MEELDKLDKFPDQINYDTYGKMKETLQSQNWNIGIIIINFYLILNISVLNVSSYFKKLHLLNL